MLVSTGRSPKGTIKRNLRPCFIAPEAYLPLPKAKEMGFGDADFLMGSCEYFDCVYEV